MEERKLLMLALNKSITTNVILCTPGALGADLSEDGFTVGTGAEHWSKFVLLSDVCFHSLSPMYPKKALC